MNSNSKTLLQRLIDIRLRNEEIKSILERNRVIEEKQFKIDYIKNIKADYISIFDDLKEKYNFSDFYEYHSLLLNSFEAHGKYYIHFEDCRTPATEISITPFGFEPSEPKIKILNYLLQEIISNIFNHLWIDVIFDTNNYIVQYGLFNISNFISDYSDSSRLFEYSKTYRIKSGVPELLDLFNSKYHILNYNSTLCYSIKTDLYNLTAPLIAYNQEHITLKAFPNFWSDIEYTDFFIIKYISILREATNVIKESKKSLFPSFYKNTSVCHSLSKKNFFETNYYNFIETKQKTINDIMEHPINYFLSYKPAFYNSYLESYSQDLLEKYVNLITDKKADALKDLSTLARYIINNEYTPALFVINVNKNNTAALCTILNLLSGDCISFYQGMISTLHSHTAIELLVESKLSFSRSIVFDAECLSKSWNKSIISLISGSEFISNNPSYPNSYKNTSTIIALNYDNSDIGKKLISKVTNLNIKCYELNINFDKLQNKSFSSYYKLVQSKANIPELTYLPIALTRFNYDISSKKAPNTNIGSRIPLNSFLDKFCEFTSNSSDFIAKRELLDNYMKFLDAIDYRKIKTETKFANRVLDYYNQKIDYRKHHSTTNTNVQTFFKLSFKADQFTQFIEVHRPESILRSKEEATYEGYLQQIINIYAEEVQSTRCSKIAVNSNPPL